MFPGSNVEEELALIWKVRRRRRKGSRGVVEMDHTSIVYDHTQVTPPVIKISLP